MFAIHFRFLQGTAQVANRRRKQTRCQLGLAQFGASSPALPRLAVTFLVLCHVACDIFVTNSVSGTIFAFTYLP